MSTNPAATQRPSVGWRTPAVIAICGCLVSMVAFGPRSALGFFLTPLSQANGWGRDVFAIALAVQNLLWGAALPFAGAIADRLGASRVIIVGAISLCAGACRHGLFADSRTAQSHGRCPDRSWPRRRLAIAGDRRLRQAAAGALPGNSRSAPAPPPAPSASSCSRRSRSP